MRESDSKSNRPYFRSDTRVFNQNGAWYVATREGDQGPFWRQEQAEEEAVRYAQACSSWRNFHKTHSHRAEPKVRLSLMPKEEQVPEAAGELELKVG